MGETLLVENNGNNAFTPPVDSFLSKNNGERYHTPVLLDECIQALAVKPEGVYVDCTLGGGGHFQTIVDRLGTKGTALGLDRDPEAIAWCGRLMKDKKATVVLRQTRFSRLGEVLDELGFDAVDGMLIDLGVSSRQITARHRGFSYMKETPLDMRMDPSDASTAADVLRASTVTDLTRILSDYGEMRNPARMAETINRCIKRRPLETSKDLKECLRGEYGETLSIKMLAKLFQALRIAVNDELNELRKCCEQAAIRLSTGGRLVVISYHSLEDRFVKNFMRDKEKGCVCPPLVPVCVCNNRKVFKRINRRAIVASAPEISRNPASRSARLRAAEKIAELSGTPSSQKGSL